MNPPNIPTLSEAAKAAELALWQKRCGDLYELAISLKRHASEAQSMYGVNAEDLIVDAENILSAVNSNVNTTPAPAVTPATADEELRSRKLLEKCFHHLGREIAGLSLNESVKSGTQSLSLEIARHLDATPSVPAPQEARKLPTDAEGGYSGHSFHAQRLAEEQAQNEAMNDMELGRAMTPKSPAPPDPCASELAEALALEQAVEEALNSIRAGRQEPPR